MDINDIINGLKEKIATLAADSAFEIAMLKAEIVSLKRENESLKTQNPQESFEHAVGIDQPTN